MRQIIPVILCIALFAGCEKEEEERDPRKLWFRGYSEHNTIFYVGGEERDASILDLSKLFDDTRRSWISEERYWGDHYFFDGDTLEIRFNGPDYLRYAYFFSNDSLFVMRDDSPWTDPFSWFMAFGSKTQLTTKQCLTYTKRYYDDGSVRSGSSFNVSEHETLESAANFSHFDGVDQMGPNDTLLLINQTKFYN